jgi:hypothetical protein
MLIFGKISFGPFYGPKGVTRNIQFAVSAQTSASSTDVPDLQ